MADTEVTNVFSIEAENAAVGEAAPPQPAESHSAALSQTQDPNVQVTIEPAIPVPAPAPEPAPAAEPPPVVAPAEPEPAQAPPAVAPPPVVEQRGGPDAAFRDMRLAQRAKKEAEQELQRERERLAALQREQDELRRQLQQATTPVPADQYDIDPLTQVQSDQAQLRAEIAQLRAQNEARSVDDQLNQQATAFSREHPDYQQALNYYVDSERKEAEVSGELDVVAYRIRTNAGAEVQRQIRDEAMRQGVTEAEVSRNLAVGVIFEARKQAMVVGAARAGRQVPDVLYELAQVRGFKSANGNGTQAPVAATPALSANLSAAEQIRAEQTQAAVGSLASLASTGTAPPKAIRSRADLLSLPAAEQERYIQHMDDLAAQGKMSPQWERDLV